MNRRSLLLIAAVLAAVAVLLAASGGVRATVGGLRVSARSPLAASMAAAAAAAAWWILARRARAVAADLDAAWSALDRHATVMVLAVAAASGLASAIYATGSAAGADASGYLSEAALWASGELFHRDPLAAVIGAADPWLTAPLGWRPGPIAGLQSPTYPPGLPLLMAIPHALGGASAAALVVTVAAALSVWTTGLLATRFGGGVAGVTAAVALATSPVFVFQSVQPMSDVPVTAAWMVMWVLVVSGFGTRDPGSVTGDPRTRSDQPPTRGDKPLGLSFPAEKPPTRGDKPLGLSFPAGIACAIAVLIRPNLAPLAAVPLVFLGWNTRRAIVFSVPVALAALVLMGLQWQWYGSPLRSGYGTADELFTVANVGANASRYFSWIVATSPVLLIAPVGVARAWRHQSTRALAAFSVLVVSAYLVYAVFDVWSYLRFLLPALAVAAVFAGAAIAAALRRAPMAWRAAGTMAVVLGLTAHGVSQARALDTFRLADQQRRVTQVAEYVAATQPAGVVIVSGEQSGALRYYTGRSILRWDAASPEALAASLSTLGTAGRPVVIALDAWEHEPFRARHRGVPAVTLEWPPAFEAGTSHRTRVWRLSDRDAFLRGEQVNTQKVP